MSFPLNLKSDDTFTFEVGKELKKQAKYYPLKSLESAS
jgi:hypothetical protein